MIFTHLIESGKNPVSSRIQTMPSSNEYFCYTTCDGYLLLLFIMLNHTERTALPLNKQTISLSWAATKVPFFGCDDTFTHDSIYRTWCVSVCVEELFGQNMVLQMPLGYSQHVRISLSKDVSECYFIKAKHFLSIFRPLTKYQFHHSVRNNSKRKIKCAMTTIILKWQKYGLSKWCFSTLPGTETKMKTYKE